MTPGQNGASLDFVGRRDLLLNILKDGKTLHHALNTIGSDVKRYLMFTQR